MLRFSYTVLDILATLLALLSPVAILHWLAGAVGVDGPVMESLNGFYAPFNSLADYLFHPPPIQFEQQQVPTAPGIVGVAFTLGFFICNMSAQALKSTEQKVIVAQDAFIQHRRMEKLRKEKQKEERKVVTNKKVLVFIQYDFDACSAAATHFEELVPRLGGTILDSKLQNMTLEFQTPERALSYCWMSAQAVLAHYRGLRPMDPQPPFQLAAHSMDAAESSSNGFPKLWQLATYAGRNTTVLSDDLAEMLQASGLSVQYRYQSMGMYAFQGEKSQEVFRLLEKRDADASGM